MDDPSVPESLRKYPTEGILKQDTASLREIQSYVEALIEYRTQPVDENYRLYVKRTKHSDTG